MMDSTYCLMKELGNLFTEKEKQRPNYIVIAPGRVNLIGEHVDHQGYSVLPIAISQSIVLAIGWSKKTTNNIPILRVINTDQDNQEKEKVFFNVKDITLNREHHWTDYVICGFWGSMLLHDVDQTNIQQILSRTNHLIPFNVLDNIQNVFLKHKNHTLTFYIASSLPSGAGLSSSSALIVGVMVGVLKCLNLNNSRQEVAVKACEIERLLGSSGGGMDQAAICLSQANKAQYIHFEPLKCESVALPHDLCIVVCNSGEQSLKIPEASTRYNKRVFELLLASLLILHHVNLLDSINPTLLLKLNLKKTQTMLHCTLPDFLLLLNTAVSHLPYYKSSILRILGSNRIDWINSDLNFSLVWTENISFEPYRRALHVLTEVQRVEKFVTLCHASNGNLSDPLILHKLGNLINECYISLTCSFDNSTVTLDKIIQSGRALGAYGARVVGAGWGGCIIFLVNQNKKDIFLTELQKVLCDTNFNMPCFKESTISNRVFVAYPENGVTIYDDENNLIEWK